MMTMRIDGREYYKTSEACRMAGISRNTFLRWIKEKSYPDVELRDRRGWRLFTSEDVTKLRDEVNRINKAN
jgi:hypothetical protein